MYHTIKQALTFDDVLLVPKQGVLEHRADADISSELYRGFKLEIPIISANMPSVTEHHMARAMWDSGGFGILHRFNTVEENIEEYCMAAIGGTRNIGTSFGYRNWSRVDSLHEVGCRIFCLDVAHGDHELTIAHIKYFKDFYPYSKLIVGNVATFFAACRLAEAGADAIKVGVGPGAACRTREVTGFGVPQLSAIIEVSRIKLKKYYPDVRIIADGGIKNSGDIVKALAAGADTVMIGSLLAGCDEAPNPGEYYGNASEYINGHRAPEGSYGKVERKGLVKDVIKELAWGIRSGISYGGATNIAELRENAEFIQVTAAGQLENKTRIIEPEYIEIKEQVSDKILARIPL